MSACVSTRRCRSCAPTWRTRRRAARPVSRPSRGAPRTWPQPRRSRSSAACLGPPRLVIVRVVAPDGGEPTQHVIGSVICPIRVPGVVAGVLGQVNMVAQVAALLAVGREIGEDLPPGLDLAEHPRRVMTTVEADAYQ